MSSIWSCHSRDSRPLHYSLRCSPDRGPDTEVVEGCILTTRYTLTTYCSKENESTVTDRGKSTDHEESTEESGEMGNVESS